MNNDNDNNDMEGNRVAILSGLEEECLNNCMEKMFITEKILKTYLPKKFSKITQKEIKHRLDNPTDSYGKYFTH